jgi:uncharacterized membrane protein
MMEMLNKDEALHVRPELWKAQKKRQFLTIYHHILNQIFQLSLQEHNNWRQLEILCAVILGIFPTTVCLLYRKIWQK